MFNWKITLDVKADVTLRGPLDEQALATLKRIEEKVDQVLEEVKPGPAVTLGMKAGPVEEQPT